MIDSIISQLIAPVRLVRGHSGLGTCLVSGCAEQETRFYAKHKKSPARLPGRGVRVVSMKDFQTNRRQQRLRYKEVLTIIWTLQAGGHSVWKHFFI